MGFPKKAACIRLPPPQTPSAGNAPWMRSGRIDGRADRRPNSSRVTWPFPSISCWTESMGFSHRDEATRGAASKAVGKIQPRRKRRRKPTKVPDKALPEPSADHVRPEADAQSSNRSRRLLPKGVQALQPPMPLREFIAGSLPARQQAGPRSSGRARALPRAGFNSWKDVCPPGRAHVVYAACCPCSPASLEGVWRGVA